MKRLTGILLAIALVLGGGAARAAETASAGGGHPRAYLKETLALRDALEVKQMDLDAEYASPEPDATRIASLRKDIIDIQAKVEAAADQHGVDAWGHGHRRGMTYASRGWTGYTGNGWGCDRW